jgi:predicted ATPase
MFCSNTQQSLSVDFVPGVNVLVAPNGTGKTTLLNAIESLVFNPEGTEGVLAETLPHKQGRSNVFFFSVKGLEPKDKLATDDPANAMDVKEVALWFTRLRLSHGQINQELMEDITEIAENGTAGLIVIDEPEIALDPNNIFQLIQRLKALCKETQFIIVSHHPWFVLNKDFNIIDLNPDIDAQKVALGNMQKLNLLSPA